MLSGSRKAIRSPVAPRVTPAAVRYAQAVEVGDPRVEGRPIDNRDAEVVVETGVAFVEGPRLGELAMLGEGDQHVVPNQHGLGHAVDLYPPPLGEAQHLGVPAHAAVEVADAQGDVVNAVDSGFSHGHQ